MQGMEVIMTFEEWFEQEFWQIDEDERFIQQMRRAWAAGYQEGAMFQRSEDRKLGGPVFGDDLDEDCPELAGDGSNYE